ncbi:MAG: ATP-grasp protein [Paucimonas sp.]|nr:ATP-grasp protein [Paucimonas sp.]
MNILFVVSQEDDWPYAIPGVQVVTARHYLTEPHFTHLTDVRVFNLCHSTDYQGRGYYVSMLAEARGHQPLPDVKAIEDLHAEGVIAPLAASLEKLYQEALQPLAPGQQALALDIWFGRTARACCATLAEQLFNTFRLPLMRVHFIRCDGRWKLERIAPLCLATLGTRDLQQVVRAAGQCLQAHRQRQREPAARTPAIAILRTPGCAAMPSNGAAIRKFRQAAQEMGMRAEVITKDDAHRLPEFDALFIRDTTNVNDYTYQIARQAAVAGLVVMDDPDSIVRCSNKVFLHELLARHDIPTPRTLLVHRDNLDQVIPTLGVPCILKQPDSAFSMGVVKVESPQQLQEKAAALFAHSELLLAQEYLPTAFDWRIGVLNRKPLFVCRYHMAPGHWQVIKHEGDSRYTEGLAEAVPLEDVPPEVIRVALQAANLIGDGFYGVDLKERNGHCTIIEINDNPNVDAGNEDGILHDALYREVVGVMRDRIEAGKGRHA